jgi:hypothetical protein
VNRIKMTERNFANNKCAMNQSNLPGMTSTRRLIELYCRWAYEIGSRRASKYCPPKAIEIHSHVDFEDGTHQTW